MQSTNIGKVFDATDLPTAAVTATPDAAIAVLSRAKISQNISTC